MLHHGDPPYPSTTTSTLLAPTTAADTTRQQRQQRQLHRRRQTTRHRCSIGRPTPKKATMAEEEASPPALTEPLTESGDGWLVEVTPLPLDAGRFIAAVTRPAAGAIATFVGTTRDSFEGKRVLRLEYEAYGPMAVAKMRVRRCLVCCLFCAGWGWCFFCLFVC
jgi:hypothetical protein